MQSSCYRQRALLDPSSGVGEDHTWGIFAQEGTGTMAVAVNTLAHTTILDAVADTAGSPATLQPATIVQAASAPRRGPRWRVPVGSDERSTPLVVEPKACAAWETIARQ